MSLFVTRDGSRAAAASKMERFVIIVKDFYNEGKSVAAERFIWTSKNNIFKHMTAISKNDYFDVLDDIVNKYKNTFHRTKKVK